MSNFRFDHLHIRTPDPEGTAAFYVTHFGAEITGRTQAGPWLRVIAKLSGVPLFIEQVAPETHAPPPPPFLGFEHIGLAVDDIDASLAKLSGAGVTVLSGPTEARPGVRIAFVAAPDGARVELIERK